MGRVNRNVVVISFFVCVLSTIARAAPLHYMLTDLGSIGSAGNPLVNAINNAGQVVGSANYTSSGSEHAFMYDGNTMQDLGVPPGGSTQSFGLAVNSLGQAVGNVNGPSIELAAYFPGPGATPQAISFGGFANTATAINSSGLIGGYYAPSSTTSGTRPVLYRNGQMTDIGLPSGTTSARIVGINEAGTAVGWGDGFGYTVSFTYSNGQFTILNHGPQPSTTARAINNHGQIAGKATIGGSVHAVLYNSGQLQDLGALGGGGAVANALNDLGQVVGEGFTPDGDLHGFVYTGSGPLIDLNTVTDNLGDITIMSGRGINISGQIACLAIDSNLMKHAVLLTPVPEPVFVLMLPLLLLGYTRIRNKVKTTNEG